MVADLLDAAVVVTESMIRYAIVWMHSNFRLIVEGGGATATAAMIATRVLSRDQIGPRPVAVVSGGNIELSLLESITEELS